MSEILIEARGLTKNFGEVRAVNDLSLEVRKGEVFGFLGPNGAGKTTTINMICGLIKPDAGQVIIDGTFSKHQNKNGRDFFKQLGMCPQDIIIWERLTCMEQLRFMGRMYGLNHREAKLRSEWLLSALSLEEKRNAQAQTLSGGMKRRLNLALALVHDPEIVILDEPVAGLDPQTRLQVREFIQSMAIEKTIILTTHNMDEADRLADRVAIIDHGELLVLDSPDVLKQQVGEGDVLEIYLAYDDIVLFESEIVTKLHSIKEEMQVEISGSMLIVRALDVVNLLPLILESLRSMNFIIGEVRLRPNTLEDVFIQLTGRRLRE